MEQVMTRVLASCPMYDITITTLIESFYNLTTFSNDQLVNFLCQYSSAIHEMDTIGYWNGSLYIFGFAAGVPSAILAILIFCRREFNTVSFFYHRVVNILELLYMAFIFENALEWMTGNLKTRTWSWCQFLMFFHYKMDLALPMAIQLIILWVAIERATMCFASRWFDLINRKSIAYIIVIGSLVVSLSVHTPLAFTTGFSFDNITRAYTRTKTGLATTSSYDAYIRFMASFALVRFALMTVATVATIIGLIQMSQRKRRLAELASPTSINAQQLMSQISINSQLCLLQLCESVPMVVNCLLLVCMQTSPYVINLVELLSMPCSQATNNVYLFRRYLYFGVTQTIIDLIEHSTHFYRYLIFSRKVQAAMGRPCKKNSVSHITVQ